MPESTGTFVPDGNELYVIAAYHAKEARTLKRSLGPKLAHVAPMNTPEGRAALEKVLKYHEERLALVRPAVLPARRGK